MRELIAKGGFFLSGVAALIYEVCWIREASYVFGSTLYAVSTVVAVFFLGLALGSEIAGRFAPRMRQPLRVFATLEIVLGMLVLLTPYGFRLAEQWLGAFYPALSDQTALRVSLRLVAVGLLLLPPTLIMGASLPLFVRHFVTRESRIAGFVGRLYAINTLGAAGGCALAGLVLVPTIGLSAAVQVGAALNICVGIVVGSLRFGTAAAPVQHPVGRPRLPREARVVAVLFFATGFAALAYEVLWIRYLALLVHNSVYTYTITLTVVLIGIVAGSLLAARFYDRRVSGGLVFGTLQILAGLIVLVVMHLPPPVWASFGDELYSYFLLLLPAAVLSGATFPLAVRMVVRQPLLASLGTGRMYAMNTLGGIAGSLTAGFLALPFLGLEASLTLTTGLSLVTGITAWFLLDRNIDRGKRRVAAVACTTLWLVVPGIADTRIPADFLAPRDVLVDYREGVNASLAVIRDKGRLNLEIDRTWQGSNTKNHQAVAAHIPMLLHPEPRSVVVVGAGSGQTPARFLMYDIERLDCVDIEPRVFDVIRDHFDSGWMADARVALVSDDGRNYLSHTQANYDVISLEVGQISRPGVASFYTAEFYRRARERLNPGGLVSQFLPLPFFTPAEFRMVLRTFLEIFPNSLLWYNTSELLLLGFDQEHLDLNLKRLDLIRANETVHQDLAYSYWGGPEYALHRKPVFLSGFLAGPESLRALAAGASLYQDDRPILEYTTSRASHLRATEIPIIELLRPHLDSVDEVLGVQLSAATKAEVSRIRDANLGDILATARIRQAAPFQGSGDYATVTALLSEALTWNPEHVDTNRMLGDVWVPQAEPAKALQSYRRALTAKPNDLLANRGIAYVLHQRGKLDEAIEHYRRVIRAWPEDADSHNNLGAALAASGQLAAARRHFEQALRLRPDFTDAGRNLARTATPAAQ